jgi:AcrR family transcriptional regulator
MGRARVLRSRKTTPAKEARSPEPARRAAILEAAHSCFWRNGIRRTSIDDIARAANVAKGTVYLYFDSKEELFASLASEMCDEVLRGVHAALEAPGPLSRRLSLALDAKIGHFHRLLSGTAHAAELMESKDTMAAKSLSALDAAFRKALDRTLAAEGIGADAHARGEALDLILAAGYGTAQHGELRGETSSEAYRARLQRHLDLLLKGLHSGPRAVVGSGTGRRRS